jgi:hypothetical protein
MLILLKKDDRFSGHIPLSLQYYVSFEIVLNFKKCPYQNTDLSQRSEIISHFLGAVSGLGGGEHLSLKHWPIIPRRRSLSQDRHSGFIFSWWTAPMLRKTGHIDKHAIKLC